ncbi:Gamma-glutamylputrescine oxidoreductase [Serratia entomophila]|uniref:NAD(P)/FAD-dependent oxidoreductase n=1 Tax=Serratia entomophila TaxID=42906 RepID=UPI0021786903|nr:FAD-binding oxidoreductase [Serratia entomophila]CAI0719606.1 Gamma-glutamylputrescine oxidoreductase [Serratia entomophila]CAI1557263.1 Gamma-glutamylputrescine oxidoreductase [Serratia entomophila]CAI1625210.1 Gamma-glutamylputrescine oxidoreductase [Serratia entomophila]CAI1629568.1 Gamma-glutamylputrescine oxidoreductase [Serratia entomophila]CAI1931245.1 Gamma-glutamylputrescine oxidoreductase [Serratia entomophila]
MTEHVASYYAATANPHAPYPALSEDIHCDVCIVGGGFSGLSAALHLAEAGYDVVLLEAARIGWGASGRNGGQVVNSYSRDVDVIEARYGAATAAMLGGMMFEGAQIIRQRIDRYAIACDYRPGGLFVALNAKQCRHLERQQANWRRYGNDRLELLDRPGIRREIASERYIGGLLDHHGGHLHPLNLALGEAEAIRGHGGRLENNVYYLQGDSGHGVTFTHLAGRLIAELLRGDAERFDAFARLPHLPFFGGRQLRVPFTALGAAYYALRDRLGL